MTDIQDVVRRLRNCNLVDDAARLRTVAADIIELQKSEITRLRDTLGIVDKMVTNACIASVAGGTKAHIQDILGKAVEIARRELDA